MEHHFCLKKTYDTCKEKKYGIKEKNSFDRFKDIKSKN